MVGVWRMAHGASLAAAMCVMGEDVRLEHKAGHRGRGAITGAIRRETMIFPPFLHRSKTISKGVAPGRQVGRLIDRLQQTPCKGRRSRAAAVGHQS